MEVTRDDLREKARSLLDVLDREGIYSNEDVRRKIGSEFRSEPLDSVSLSTESSAFGTRALTIAYGIPFAGVPIELRVNENVGYSLVILKCQERLEDYSLFESPSVLIDDWGNIVQYKFIESPDFLLVRDEVAMLAD